MKLSTEKIHIQGKMKWSSYVTIVVFMVIFMLSSTYSFASEGAYFFKERKIVKVSKPGSKKPVNLARGKPATQSSVYRGTGVDQGPHLGVDGVINPPSVTPYGLVHTAMEQSPWWQVDLGKVYALTLVRIYNRVDCCGEKIATLEIKVSNDGNNWKTVYSHDGRNFDKLDVPIDRIRARFVRLQLQDRNFLHFREVEVYGFGGDGGGQKASVRLGELADSTDSISKVHCTNSKWTYKEGEFLQCLQYGDKVDCLKKGYFVCRQGTWKKEKAPPMDGVDWKWDTAAENVLLTLSIQKWQPYPGNKELMKFFGLREKTFIPARGEGSEDDEYLRREGGMVGIYYRLVDKNGTEIRTADALRQWIGTVNTANKAMLLVHSLLSDTRVFSAAQFDGDYLVFAVKKHRFGCGTHKPQRMLYQVTPNGKIEVLAEENMPRLSRKTMGICVD